MLKKKCFKFYVMDTTNGELTDLHVAARTLIGAKSRLNLKSFVVLSITITGRGI